MKPSTSSIRIACVVFALVVTGCPAPTPGERIRQLGGVVTPKGGGVVDLDLSGTNVTDQDMAYIHGFCSNDPNLESIHTLDLSDTAITDEAIKFMTLQREFSSGGIQVLVIRNTKVNDSAIEQFQAGSPNCKIVR